MQWGHSFVERAAELHPREKVIWRRLLFFKKKTDRVVRRQHLSIGV
jgi:hypothetical protein